MLRLTSHNVATVSAAWAIDVETALAAKGMTRVALAASVDVTRQYLSKILDGTKPTAPTATYVAICRALELDPNDYTEIQESTPPWED